MAGCGYDYQFYVIKQCYKIHSYLTFQPDRGFCFLF